MCFNPYPTDLEVAVTEDTTPSRDDLTGLLNRMTVQTLVHNLIQDASADHPLSVALLDIDHFAAFDYERGLEVGDALLANVAADLRSAVGPDVIMARYSRDTFLLVWPDRSADESFLATEKLRARFDDREVHLKTAHGEVVTQITMSGGVAAYPSLAENDRELLRNAHAALFRAKTTGRSRTAFAQPERLEPKTVHFAPGQLRRLGELSHMAGRSDASLLREALDDLLAKYYSQRTPPVRPEHP